jgi:hypothetical protein
LRSSPHLISNRDIFVNKITIFRWYIIIIERGDVVFTRGIPVQNGKLPHDRGRHPGESRDLSSFGSALIACGAKAGRFRLSPE